MQNRILSTILSLVACITVCAQESCIINGKIADAQLSNGKKIKKVSLTHINELGQEIVIAEAKIKKGKYRFKYELATDEPIMLHTIKGFGQEIELFVEPGEITITTESASKAGESIVTGTPTNNLYNEYKNILTKEEADAAKQIAALEESNDEEWLASADGQNTIKRINARERIRRESQTLKFLIEHNASPISPLEIERTFLSKLSAAYAEQMTKAMSTSLHNHPYYLSLRNAVLANNLKVGNEVPDITLPLENNTTAHLTDYRGKYILLNFWTTDCDKSAQMLTELHKVHDMIKGKQEEFIIISFALESATDKWKEAIKNNNLNLEGWLHACDGIGKQSPAAKLYKVGDTPKTILIEPEGLAVSLDMDIEEISMRIEQIISGDLYYLDNQE